MCIRDSHKTGEEKEDWQHKGEQELEKAWEIELLKMMTGRVGINGDRNAGCGINCRPPIKQNRKLFYFKRLKCHKKGNISENVLE